MTVEIIGGGPAGLYFAILAKRRFPEWNIHVTERNGRNDTFGWGVVFSDRTLDKLKEHDPTSAETIIDNFEVWENVEVVHKNEHIFIGGNRFSGISRLVMLNILQDRAESLGVNLTFNKEVRDLDEVAAADLVIVADGVNSFFRKKYPAYFEPDLSIRSNKYIWYGTNQLFNALTLTLRENADGIFASHSYKFNETTSTFVVECDPETWRKAGFESMNDAETRSYLETVFADDLGGHPLLSNKSTWINFLLVKNKKWVHDNIVIIGDAAATAHFSIGSGTKLALEEAIALFHSFENHHDIKEALTNYETTHKPIVEEYQQLAYDSLLLFENLKDIRDLAPIEMAYKMMTRSKRLDHEKLRKRDPEFVKRVEEFRSK
ncbi:MAG TPA: FAD-dependent monooxygenase [Candidatus Kapabacteria bacterium]|nr:FAD-dependent monooxygenase [Candidatus Kapabacteria bacterium]